MSASTPSLVPNSTALFARAQQLMPGGVNSPVRAFRSVGGAPFFVKAARGATLLTADDRVLIDFVCTWGPAIHGHNHPVIKKAIAAALESGTSFGTPNPYEVEMAELIVRFVPSIKKVRLCNSGTEATMSAIRLARGFTKRDKIIKFSGCYHGHSDSLLIKAGSGALTHGHPDSAGIPASFAQETIVLPYNDRAALDAAFAANPEKIACVIIEPYCGNVGFIMPDPGYLAYLREITAKHGTVLIFDEVMTGFRIAKGGVQERENITPDLTCLGKIIGGGLPVGAFGGRADIMDHLAPLGPVYQAGTLSGNPLAMAAGIAGLKLLEEQNPYVRLDALGQRLRDAVLAAARNKGLPVHVPQCGSMFSIFFTDTPVRDYATALKSDAKIFAKFFHLCLEKGVYLAPSAYEAGFLSTAHDGPAIDRACDVLTESLHSL
ncbi:glutamate-1-semialdehyde-2,1-aminomutase [Nibricoccus aquaticus]|uniref:Glutamate-1-semialdehyde 2,1-aminomutase n=1 Tax=Nibricoccus aquaticus TaxID=2576891 RepID=A0A290QB04_9BACT|nr:glutamate-1-semialdehyde 2,1-aminomutase [Nibricoccus aquaticus]ATC65849.1 glutamate-1-semialdehyde-2,1-aminomutase [Nibricoccus aquaticus]